MSKKRAPAPPPSDTPAGGGDGVIIDLDLDLIDVGASVQVRTKDDDEFGATVDEYARAIRDGATFPPLLVAEANDGKYRLVAGFHRLAAARRAGLKSFPAVVVGGDDDQLYLRAVLDNIHGRPLRNSDKRAIADRMVRRYPDASVYSSMVLSKMVAGAISHNTFNEARQRFEGKATRDRSKAGRERVNGSPPSADVIEGGTVEGLTIEANGEREDDRKPIDRLAAEAAAILRTVPAATRQHGLWGHNLDDWAKLGADDQVALANAYRDLVAEEKPDRTVYASAAEAEVRIRNWVAEWGFAELPGGHAVIAWKPEPNNRRPGIALTRAIERCGATRVVGVFSLGLEDALAEIARNDEMPLNLFGRHEWIGGAFVLGVAYRAGKMGGMGAPEITFCDLPHAAAAVHLIFGGREGLTIQNNGYARESAISYLVEHGGQFLDVLGSVELCKATLAAGLTYWGLAPTEERAEELRALCRAAHDLDGAGTIWPLPEMPPIPDLVAAVEDAASADVAVEDLDGKPESHISPMSQAEFGGNLPLGVETAPPNPKGKRKKGVA